MSRQNGRTRKSTRMPSRGLSHLLSLLSLSFSVTLSQAVRCIRRKKVNEAMHWLFTDEATAHGGLGEYEMKKKGLVPTGFPSWTKPSPGLNHHHISNENPFCSLSPLSPLSPCLLPFSLSAFLAFLICSSITNKLAKFVPAKFDKKLLLLTTIVACAGNFRVETADVTYELPGLGGGGQGWGSSVGLHAIGECLHEAHTK